MRETRPHTILAHVQKKRHWYRKCAHLRAIFVSYLERKKKPARAWLGYVDIVLHVRLAWHGVWLSNGQTGEERKPPGNKNLLLFELPRQVSTINRTTERPGRAKLAASGNDSRHHPPSFLAIVCAGLVSALDVIVKRELATFVYTSGSQKILRSFKEERNATPHLPPHKSQSLKRAPRSRWSPFATKTES